ncbi:glycosyltransferase family 2 protein [Listeria riparia]|uniref:N-acetyl-glucosamine transferase n=1 Tax=Listeria riparia FSL S10-1204 TaxID=1265816 RepID=W7D4B4_9LIST|nr:glycosyltransferase [Listeria riparia]EUJ42731.1 N-acetyl-glucosamine transferase [Listeria riparia FSL S10-1204]
MNGLLTIMAGVSVCLIFIYFSYTSLILLLPPFAGNKNKVSEQDDSDLEYVFLIPCLNEEVVIEKTIRSILALSYQKKMVIVVDDDSSDNTVAIVRQMNLPNVRVIERKKPNAQLGKGESLNYAYSKIIKAARRLGKSPTNLILTVIDGDGRPSDNLLTEANRVFRDTAVGAAQARIRITNRKRILPMMQDIEFYSTVAAIQNSREYTESVGLGGNGQFTRLSALVELGPTPWSKCLLEDFDLGLSILLKGWKSKYIGDAIVYQQGLTSVKKFIRQRARWVQGNIQSIKRLREIRKSDILSSASKLDIYYFLAQPWINLLGSIIMIISWGLMLLFFRSVDWGAGFTNTLQDWGAILVIIGLIFGPGLIWCIYHYELGRKDKDGISFFHCMGAGLFMPIYNLIAIPSIWLAFWRQVARKEAWAKTERVAE